MICNIYQDIHEMDDYLALPQIKSIYQLRCGEYDDIDMLNQRRFGGQYPPVQGPWNHTQP